MERGIHEVSARRFVLISADHPIVSAISENASKLQVGDIVSRSGIHSSNYQPHWFFCQDSLVLACVCVFVHSR